MTFATQLQQLLEFDGALLANTIGYLDPTPAAELYMGGDILCQTPGTGPMVGVAVTCEIDSSTPGGSNEMDLYYDQLEQIYPIAEPVVWVVKAVGSRPDHECIMGDGMAKSLQAAGCVGIVTNGGLRDVPSYSAVPFKAFARGRVIHHAALRVRRINEPVEVGGLTIRPGDIIHGSDEGVVRIPRACLAQLPERAAQMRAFEYEAHFIFRDPAIPLRSKGGLVKKLLEKYGFA